MSSRSFPLAVALLCDHRAGGASTVRAHIESIERCSRHRVERVSMLGELPPALDLRCFDAVVIHYSLMAGVGGIGGSTRQRLRDYGGAKVAFVQDEYRNVDRTVAALREIGVHVLFTSVPEQHVDSIYGEARLPGVRTVCVLTGYVSPDLTRLSVPPPSARPLLVGYRGRYLPAWLGELGQEKWRIGSRFLEDAPSYGIACDISWREEDRLYGRKWVEFLTRCRAVLGVESGASVIDFSGEIQARTERYLAAHPDAAFEEVRMVCFAEEDGRHPLNQISPRCFEAAALRTVMVLYEGSYSNALEPLRHYIPLRKNHANMGRVAAALADGRLCDEIAHQAYHEVALAPAYAPNAVVARLDREIEEQVARLGYRGSPAGPWLSLLRRIPSATTLRQRLRRHVIELGHRWVFGRLLRCIDPRARAVMRGRLRRVARNRTATPVEDR